MAGLASVALGQQLGSRVGVLLECGRLGDGGVFIECEGWLVDQIFVLLPDAGALQLPQPHVVAADLPQRRLMRADGHDLILREPSELL